MKKRIICVVCMILSALFCVGFAVLAALSVAPAPSKTEVREEFTAASSLLASDGPYLTEVRGALQNRLGETVTVEKLEITVAGEGGREMTLTVPAKTIPPRSFIPVSAAVQTDHPFTTVLSVRATDAAGTHYLANPAGGNPVIFLILAILAVLFALAFVRSLRVWILLCSIRKEERNERA